MSILCKLGFHNYRHNGIKIYYGWFHNFIYDKFKCSRCDKEIEKGR